MDDQISAVLFFASADRRAVFVFGDLRPQLAGAVYTAVNRQSASFGKADALVERQDRSVAQNQVKTA